MQNKIYTTMAVTNDNSLIDRGFLKEFFKRIKDIFALKSELPTDYLTGGSQTSTSTADGGSNVFTFTKSDGATATFTVKNGTKGSTGGKGNGVKSTAITYQASTSGTTTPTGTWSNTVPSVTKGQYLWTKTVLTYDDNSTSTAYSVGYQGTNGTNATTTAVATTSANGLMSSSDKTKLDGIETGANNYEHPTGDGNLHVPATGTSNDGKVLTAGATAGSLSWTTPLSIGTTATTAAAGNHTHGSLTNGGAISSATTMAKDDDVAFLDKSDSYKLKRSTLRGFEKALIEQAASGSSDVTDSTELLTSYASNNGFADTNAPNQMHKRKFSCVWNYIKGKIEAAYTGLNNTGTVTQVKVGTTAYDPSSGVVSLPAYPTVTNSLTSTSTTAALSAAQGKALNDKFGSYLPLSGGTMTGTINSQDLLPKTTDAYSLGSSSNKFTSSYVQTSANIGLCTQTYNTATHALEFSFV